MAETKEAADYPEKQGTHRLVSNFTELHVLTLAALSYALLICAIRHRGLIDSHVQSLPFDSR